MGFGVHISGGRGVSWNQSLTNTRDNLSFGEVKFIHGFFTMQGSVPLTPALFKDQLYMFYTSFDKFKYFILFDTIINGMAFLISILDCLLLEYRNKLIFCVDFLYPATLLNLLAITVFWWNF